MFRNTLSARISLAGSLGPVGTVDFPSVQQSPPPPRQPPYLGQPGSPSGQVLPRSESRLAAALGSSWVSLCRVAVCPGLSGIGPKVLGHPKQGSFELRPNSCQRWVLYDTSSSSFLCSLQLQPVPHLPFLSHWALVLGACS